MPRSKSYWSEFELTLIEAVKEHPILYTKNESSSKSDNSHARQLAFKEVSTKTCMPVDMCKRKFNDLKLKYITLKHMIRSGKLPEEIIPKIPIVLKMLSGILDFLDPYIDDTPIHSELSSRTERFYRGTLKEIDRILKVENIINKLIDQNNANNETNVQLISVMPTDEPMHIMLTDESETIVKNSTIKNATTHEEAEEFILSDLNITVDRNIVTDVSSANDPIQMFLMKYGDDNDDGFDIKQYFNELAELLCARLVLGKRQNFLNHIDLLVSEMLEG